MTSDSNRLRMTVQMTVIDNLGLKMYASLPPVLSELVANSWDAEARHVYVRVPEEEIGDNSVIEVEDDGHGMSFDEINETYLLVGRNRRETKGALTSNLGRKVMGRKGIGKLSVFGVADQAEVQTIRDNLKTVFLLDLNQMRETPPGEDYEPTHPSALY